jgi:hypothetical protein
MKLRIEGNSVRLRVKKSDLEKLKTDGIVRESVAFLKGFHLYYELKTDDKIKTIEASFSSGTIAVSIPLSMSDVWIDTEQVGIENTAENGFYVLIEKDFPCKTRADEDKNDLFQELATGMGPSVFESLDASDNAVC